MLQKIIQFFLITFMVFNFAACAASQNSTPDPFEPVNRVMFNIHNSIDKTVLIPVTRAYGVLPERARKSVGNFFSNLSDPFSMVNNLLQGKPIRASSSLARFGINSTLGLGGLFDVASSWGLEKHPEDFGQTLGYYGIGTGVYIFIPILGPKTLRDGIAQISSASLTSTAYDGVDISDAVYLGTTALNGIHARHSGLALLEEIEKSSVDYYASVRSLYLQNRASQINDGKLDIDDLPDLDMLDDFDEEDDFFEEETTKEKDYK